MVFSHLACALGYVMPPALRADEARTVGPFIQLPVGTSACSIIAAMASHDYPEFCSLQSE